MVRDAKEVPREPGLHSYGGQAAGKPCRERPQLRREQQGGQGGKDSAWGVTRGRRASWAWSGLDSRAPAKLPFQAGSCHMT